MAKGYKGYSEDLARWHRGDLWAIVEELKSGNPEYTHHFAFLKRSSLTDRTHIRKSLWTLEKMGLVKNINQGFNIHQWQITEEGKALPELTGLKIHQLLTP